MYFSQRITMFSRFIDKSNNGKSEILMQLSGLIKATAEYLKNALDKRTNTLYIYLSWRN